MNIPILFLSISILLIACSEEKPISNSMEVNGLSNDSSMVVSDSVFTGGIEGPAVNAVGDLFLVNLEKEGTIGWKKFNEDSFKVFVELPNKSIANGIRFNAVGDMFMADYAQHNILKIEKGTRQVSVYAHDSSMNQPNDLAIMDNGILFASDPNWGESTGKIWRINLDGSTTLLEDSMGTTNGIEVSPDNKKLYVNESVQRKVWVYNLSPKGDISNKKVLIEFPDFGMDGMRTDKAGNLFVARYGKGVVAVVSPRGELLKEVKLNGEKPTNVAFGGKDGKTVYVTMQGKKWVEAFKSEIPGRSFQSVR